MVRQDYIAVLNPFSEEAKEIVKDAPSFESLSDRIIDLAVDRINVESGSEMNVDFDEDSIRDEILSFYLMCQGVAAVSYPYSNEVRTIIEATKKTIRFRLFDLFRREHEDVCYEAIDRSFRLRELKGEDSKKLGDTEIPQGDIYKIRDLELQKDDVETVSDEIIPQYIPKYAIHWTDLTPLIEHRHIDLTDQYIVDGWALITPKTLWNFFANYISSEMEEYVSDLYDRFSEGGSPSEVLKEVGTRISESVPEEKSYASSGAMAGGGELKPEAFPPCIKDVMGGVSSGNRNYGIVALLTPFLSYARVSPSGKSVTRIADFIEDLSVVEDDIIPLVFKAAERSKPPLFDDQPEDKANVYYHMGFGMTTQPRLKDSGKSKWYRPPNCRKIKTESPALCNPDELCSEIKNPLTYYYKKLSKDSSSGED